MKVSTNLIYHLAPINNWRRHLHILKAHLPLFTGKVIIAFPQEGPGLETINTNEIEDYLPEAEIFTHKNHHLLREAVSFPLLIERLRAANPDPTSITCYAHGKGVSKPKSPAVEVWTNALYYLTWFHMQEHIGQLETTQVSGAFVRHGKMPCFPKLPVAARWHYSGTFWWMRTEALLNPRFPAPKHRYGIEAYPAILFPDPKTAGCVFCPQQQGSLYKMNRLKHYLDIIDSHRPIEKRLWATYNETLQSYSRLTTNEITHRVPSLPFDMNP